MKRFCILVFSFCVVLSLGGCRKEQPLASLDEMEVRSVGDYYDSKAADADPGDSLAYGTVSETEAERIPLATEEAEEVEVPYDKHPIVMIEGKLYYDTGKKSDITRRCGVMDGEITSTVGRTQVPAENGQSNFGSGYGYQRIRDDTIEILMDGKWTVFEHRSTPGFSIRFEGQWYNEADLSEETLKWLNWYNQLPGEIQRSVNYVPRELIALQPTSNAGDQPAPTDSSGQYIPADEQTSAARQPLIQETDAGGFSADPLGLRLETADVSPTGLTLIIHQSDGSPTGTLQAGTPYLIEQETAGTWTPLSPLHDFSWEDLAMHITKEGITEWPIDWTYTYGPLSPGHYRLKKEIMDYRSPGDYDLHTYFVQFTLTN